MELECLQCGKVFTKGRANQRCCCTKCSVMYLRNNKDGALEYPKCKFTEGIECSGGDCSRCGWNPTEAKRREELFVMNGITPYQDGLHRLIIKKEENNGMQVV